MDETLMSVDPGGTTGWVCARVVAPAHNREESTHEVALRLKASGNMTWGEVKGTPEDQAMEIHRRIVSSQVSTCIIESFYLDPPLLKKVRTADILSPVKVAYALVGICAHSLWDTRIVWQPSSAMTVITDERLHRWDLWIPGKKDARAALKHMLVYLRGTDLG